MCTKNTKIPIWIDVTANALAIRPIIMWPALMLAINRTIKVSGRIQILTVSIKTNKGIRAAGAPAGAKWAADSIGNLIHPDKIKATQNTNAIEDATQIFLVVP